MRLVWRCVLLGLAMRLVVVGPGKEAFGRHAAFRPYLATNRDAANLEVHATVSGQASAAGSGG
jgi:hypothetical protein